MDAQKIRIRLKAYDHFALDRSTKEIARTVVRTGARLVGPIPLPTKKTIYTVLRSPHVDKKSREQFETRVHKRVIDVAGDERTLRQIMRVRVPENVQVMISLE